MKDTEPQKKPTFMEQVGGVPGLIFASVPSVVFVAADAMAGLHIAVAVALASAVGIAAWRLYRKESFNLPLSGLLGVIIGAFIAYQTGESKDYFLVGIWMSFASAVVFFLSVLVRRPLVGVIWGALSGRGQVWRTDRRSVIAYDVASLAVAAVSASRFVVQNWLYDADSTGWLAFARIAMGHPLTALALLAVVWAVRRSARSLDHQTVSSN